MGKNGTSGLKTRSVNPRLFELLAETFQALGDPSRVQIIWALSQGESPVGLLAKRLSVSPSSVSHHLRMLRNLKLVRTRRQGQSIYYCLDDRHIERLLSEGIEHVTEFMRA